MITKVAFQRLRRMSVLSLLVAVQATMLFSCRANAHQSIKRINMEKENLKEIYLAGGCFWGTEHYFKQIDGWQNGKPDLQRGMHGQDRFCRDCSCHVRSSEGVIEVPVGDVFQGHRPYKH